MTGRNRSIIVLGVVFVILAGISYWLTSTPATPPTPTPEPTYPLWDYGAATVQGVTVQSPTSTVTLQVTGGKWEITAPVQQPADDLQVSQATDPLKKAEGRAKIGDNVTDLAQYGLDSPALTVTLVLSGATVPKADLLVGKPNVDGSAYYARPQGSNAVYLLNNTLIEPFKSWLTTPPIAQPTATAIPATIIPAPSPPTSTGTLSGTESLPLTPGLTPEGPVAPATGTPEATPATANTPSAAGTEPPVGASPVSSPPASGTDASPVPSGSGGGAGGTPGTVSTPTP
ncbi:MAG TPA: DUF4340 domain-containing protein [Chloroflexia bacterium]|jgi:hypothetical protein|nr:DUF4340 domain-containing protein [Chloroflexia bacterium]